MSVISNIISKRPFSTIEISEGGHNLTFRFMPIGINMSNRFVAENVDFDCLFKKETSQIKQAATVYDIAWCLMYDEDKKMFNGKQEFISFFKEKHFDLLMKSIFKTIEDSYPQQNEKVKSNQKKMK